MGTRSAELADTTRRWLIPMAAVGIWASACTTAEPVAAARTAVVGGAPAEADEAVVALVGPFGAPYCSGTLVAPTLVATAAHCVEAPSTPLVQIHRADGTSSDRPVADVLVHADYDPVTLSADLALLVLESPAGVLPLSPARGAPIGDTLRAVGFGNDGETNARSRSSGDVSVIGIFEDEIVVEPGPATPCRGDSGGALIQRTEAGERLVAIISRGDDACRAGAVGMRFDEELLLSASFAPVGGAVDRIESHGEVLGDCSASVPGEDRRHAAFFLPLGIEFVRRVMRRARTASTTKGHR